MDRARIPTFRENAMELVDDIIARYQSIEQKRIAIRKALKARPDDPWLQDAMMRLMTSQLVKQAATSGIFINYTRTDELFAIELAEGLREAGITPWLDIVDMIDDSDWENGIEQALKSCGLMLAILSPEAQKDGLARMERQRFADMGKLVQPVIHHRCVLDKEFFWLEPVDFSRDFAYGLRQLVRLISATETAQV